MQFSIVIPSYNRVETLKEVLPSLERQEFPVEDYEILLCDAGSTDGTKELVDSLAIENLRWLPGGDSGRAGARNRGIGEAQGEIVLFTDADIIADPLLLQQHQRTHQLHPGDAVVGCEIQIDTLEEYYAYRQDPQRHARHSPGRQHLPWHYFLTGNASVRRSDLEEVGGFDEDFTGYGHEDLELGYRLLKAGLTIHYNAQAVNYHWHPVPFAEQCDKMHLAGRSTVKFYKKHRDWRIALQMGYNPLALLVHAMVREGGPVYRAIRSFCDSSHWAREFILQHHYVTGIKSAR